MKNFRNKNIVEIFYQVYKNPRENVIGGFLFLLHILYITVLLFTLAFSTNTWALFILLLVLAMNIFIIFMYRSCPLYLMEASHFNTNCMRSITLLFLSEDQRKERKPRKKREKVLSKHLDYCLHESTTQNLIVLYLLTCIKMFYLFF